MGAASTRARYAQLIEQYLAYETSRSSLSSLGSAPGKLPTSHKANVTGVFGSVQGSKWLLQLHHTDCKNTSPELTPPR